MNNNRTPIRKIAFAAITAAVYIALTLLMAPISYGPIQFRLSEALCILPFFFPVTTWGLFVGCMLANIVSAYGILDIVFGSLATLLAALFTMMLGKLGCEKLINKVLACFPPVLFNAVIIGAVIAHMSLANELFWTGFIINAAQVAIGEAAIMFLIGLPLLIWLPKNKLFNEISKKYH